LPTISYAYTTTDVEETVQKLQELQNENQRTDDDFYYAIDNTLYRNYDNEEMKKFTSDIIKYIKDERKIKINEIFINDVVTDRPEELEIFWTYTHPNGQQYKPLNVWWAFQFWQLDQRKIKISDESLDISWKVFNEIELVEIIRDWDMVPKRLIRPLWSRNLYYTFDQENTSLWENRFLFRAYAKGILIEKELLVVAEYTEEPEKIEEPEGFEIIENYDEEELGHCWWGFDENDDSHMDSIELELADWIEMVKVPDRGYSECIPGKYIKYRNGISFTYEISPYKTNEFNWKQIIPLHDWRKLVYLSQWISSSYYFEDAQGNKSSHWYWIFWCWEGQGVPIEFKWANYAIIDTRVYGERPSIYEIRKNNVTRALEYLEEKYPWDYEIDIIGDNLIIQDIEGEELRDPRGYEKHTINLVTWELISREYTEPIRKWIRGTEYTTRNTAHLMKSKYFISTNSGYDVDLRVILGEDTPIYTVINPEIIDSHSDITAIKEIRIYKDRYVELISMQ